MRKMHGLLEDIGAEIGYTATTALVDWFGGANLHIPLEASEDHPIAKVIGMPAFKRLVAMFDGHGRGRLIWISLEYHRELDRRDRMISVLYEMGLGSKQIANIALMSERAVQSVRARVEELGLLPLIIKQAGIPQEKCQGKPTPEIRGKNPQENPGAKPGGKAGGSKCVVKSHGKTQGHGQRRIKRPW